MRLLPCPFCGSDDVDPEGWSSLNPDTGERRDGPACQVCDGSTESVELWNSRPLAEKPTLRMAPQVAGKSREEPNNSPPQDAIERVKAMIAWIVETDGGPDANVPYPYSASQVAAHQYAEDLRTLLSALQKANAALEEKDRALDELLEALGRQRDWTPINNARAALALSTQEAGHPQPKLSPSQAGGGEA